VHAHQTRFGIPLPTHLAQHALAPVVKHGTHQLMEEKVNVLVSQAPYTSGSRVQPQILPLLLHNVLARRVLKSTQAPLHVNAQQELLWTTLLFQEPNGVTVTAQVEQVVMVRSITGLIVLANAQQAKNLIILYNNAYAQVKFQVIYGTILIKDASAPAEIMAWSIMSQIGFADVLLEPRQITLPEFANVTLEARHSTQIHCNVNALLDSTLRLLLLHVSLDAFKTMVPCGITIPQHRDALIRALRQHQPQLPQLPPHEQTERL